MPDESDLTCGDYARVLCFHHTRGCGCIGRPAFPTPSFFQGERFMHNSGASRREIAEPYFAITRHRPPTVRANARPTTGSGGRSSIRKTSAMESKGRNLLDTPHARGMTARRGSGCLKLNAGSSSQGRPATNKLRDAFEKSLFRRMHGVGGADMHPDAVHPQTEQALLLVGAVEHFRQRKVARRRIGEDRR
jgi:hypothetical protein